MKYILYWDIPVDKRQEAMMAYWEIAQAADKGMTLDPYWTADSSEGEYRGVGILDVAWEDALYDFFGIAAGIADLQLVPAVSGERVMALWQKELGEPGR